MTVNAGHAIGSFTIGSGRIGDPAPYRWRPRAGQAVRYRNASGRIFHAVITNVDSETQVDLRVGRTAFANVPRATERHDNVAGWFRVGQSLVNP